MKNIKRKLTIVALAVPLGLGGAAVGTVAQAAPDSAHSAEAATLGWGKYCYSKTVRTGSWGIWGIYTTSHYYEFTTSLTGTRCVVKSTSTSYKAFQ